MRCNVSEEEVASSLKRPGKRWWGTQSEQAHCSCEPLRRDATWAVSRIG